jgi:hypothetical protein
MNFAGVDIHSRFATHSSRVDLGRPYIVSLYEHQEFY